MSDAEDLADDFVVVRRGSDGELEAFLEMYREQGATEETAPFVRLNLRSSTPFSRG